MDVGSLADSLPSGKPCQPVQTCPSIEERIFRSQIGEPGLFDLPREVRDRIYEYYFVLTSGCSDLRLSMLCSPCLSTPSSEWPDPSSLKIGPKDAKTLRHQLRPLTESDLFASNPQVAIEARDALRKGYVKLIETVNLGLQLPNNHLAANAALTWTKSYQELPSRLWLRIVNADQITLWALGCFATLFTNPRFFARPNRIQAQRGYIA